MEVGKLTAQLRTTTGKEQNTKLRQKGLIPAVCYGGKKVRRHSSSPQWNCRSRSTR